MGIAGRIDRTTVVGSNDHAAYRGIVIADILDCWVGRVPIRNANCSCAVAHIPAVLG